MHCMAGSLNCPAVHVAPAGDRALLVDLGEVTAAQLHAAAARLRSREDVLACIVGHSSLYVLFRGAPDLALDVTGGADDALPRRLHRVEVAFDGEDLGRLPVSRDELLARIGAIRLTARYLGFRAGWAYLDGWPPEWAVPRRATSRPVARGSFAIAGTMAGFYPIDTPGGWNVLGHTAEVPEIHAGDEIEIVPVKTLPAIAPLPLGEGGPERAKRVEGPGEGFPITFKGPLATVVDRADYSRLDRGLSPGGPFDPRANALAPLLECALAGPRVRFTRGGIATWFGARSELPHGSFRVEEGEERTIGRLRGGLRGWLAFGERETPSYDDDYKTIRVMAGPHETPLRSIECEVTPQLDRVGIRLRPLTPVGFSPPADLPSCGMQFGTIQLHPDGSLVAMGPDHPITGGYLQPLTVMWDERWKLGQLAPGDRVQFAHSP